MIIGLIVFFTAVTIKRNEEWTNSETLWYDTLELYPTWGQPRLGLGNYYLELGDIEEAKRQYLIGIISGNPEIHINLAKLYNREKRYNETKQSLENFIQEKKIYIGSQELGIAYAETNNCKKAIQILETHTSER